MSQVHLQARTRAEIAADTSIRIQAGRALQRHQGHGAQVAWPSTPERPLAPAPRAAHHAKPRPGGRGGRAAPHVAAAPG